MAEPAAELSAGPVVDEPTSSPVVDDENNSEEDDVPEKNKDSDEDEDSGSGSTSDSSLGGFIVKDGERRRTKKSKGEKKKSKRDKTGKNDKKKRQRDMEDESDEEESDEEEEMQRTKAKAAKRKKKKVSLFLEDVDEGGDDEDDDLDEKMAREAEEVLDEDVEAAIQAVERRHQKQKEFLSRSADEVAADYIKRHKVEAKMKQKFESRPGMAMGARSVAQQALLPSVRDPTIFKVKCKTGFEQQLVRSIMLKALDPRANGGVLKIKSAFCNSTKGVVYVEALNETFVKETINGLRLLYVTSVVQIPVQEMTAVLQVSVKKRPLNIGQFVRVKRGPLKGDLARVINLFEGGAKAFIQAVPRPDYSDITAVANGGAPGAKKTMMDSTLRPVARLFDPAEVLKELPNAYVARNRHPLDPTNTQYDIWNNDYYRHGFLYKEVNVNTYLNTDDPRPKVEELMLFRGSARHKSGRARTADDVQYDDEFSSDEDDEDVDGSSGKAPTGANFLKELAAQIKTLGEEEAKDNVSPYVPGDMVMVVGGEMQNLVARVVSVDDAAHTAKIKAINQTISGLLEVELDLLTKYIEPGCHIKVVVGSYMGITGRVVSVYKMGESYIASIISDGTNSAMDINVGHIQMSNEVSIGQGSLMGYELYDLVGLHDNDNAVVIQVGSEKLTVINQTGSTEVVDPRSLQPGKRNQMSLRSSGYDVQSNTIVVGDTVNVVSGKHVKLSGTIKHQMKGILWLHSKSYLPNSGIFVVRAKHVVVSGGKSATLSLSNGYGGVLQPSPQGPSTAGGASTGGSTAPKHSFPSGRFGKDAAIGKTVKITKGKYKGMLAQVCDVTPTHYNVEILAKLVKAVIDRNHTVPVGDKDGSFEAKSSGYGGGGGSSAAGVGRGGQVEITPNTPYLTSQTPLASMGATPAYRVGSETPGYYGESGSSTPGGLGSRTPLRVEDGYFRVTAEEKRAAALGSSSSVTDSSMYGSGSASVSGSMGPYSSIGGGSGLPSSSYEPSPAFTDMYSPAQSSVYTPNVGSETPLSMGTDGGSGVSFREWSENFVVRLLEGQYQGRFAVLQTRADESGTFQVSLRDGSGKVEPRAFPMHYSDLALADAPKKETVLVLSGEHKGQRGVIKVVQNKDAFVQLPNTTSMLKINKLAWINHDSGK